MRPVEVPAATNYDEQEQLKVLVSRRSNTKKRKRWENVDKHEIVRTLDDLIDTWVGAGCPLTRSGTPSFTDSDDEQLYKDNYDLLTAGGGSWGDARRDMIQGIGAYCSYCGSPIYSHLAIEHRLPKNTFTLFAFDYSNFLLACATCNSAKGNKPNQATIPGHPAATQDAFEYITNTNATHYLWADFDWTTITAPSRFPFTCTLNWLTASRNRLRYGNPVLPQDQNRLLTMFIAGTLGVQRGVYYEPYGSGNRYKHLFGVQVVPDASLNQTLQDAATRIIDLASLNKIIPASDSSKSVDRRLETRTRAYFTARIVKQQLADAAIADPHGANLLPAVIEQARQTIRATGQWLIWLLVLGNDIYNGVAAQTLIRQCMTGTSTVDWVV